jgi:hypothetical protein
MGLFSFFHVPYPRAMWMGKLLNKALIDAVLQSPSFWVMVHGE